jgi:hypothetical protein
VPRRLGQRELRGVHREESWVHHWRRRRCHC